MRQSRPQPPPWKFYDFVNERRENEILAWATAQGPKLRARLNALIRYLELLDRFSRADNVGLLRKDGPCKGHGLIELIITIGKVEYRPIGWYGPGSREVTLLVGATERGNDFDPRNACAQAVNRKRLVMTSGRYIVDHKF